MREMQDVITAAQQYEEGLISNGEMLLQLTLALGAVTALIMTAEQNEAEARLRVTRPELPPLESIGIGA